MFKPDLSEKGKNFARNSKILPQNTVCCERESLLNKSLHILNRLFLQALKNKSSFHTETLFSTKVNNCSHLSRVIESKISPSSITGILPVAKSFLHNSMQNVMYNSRECTLPEEFSINTVKRVSLNAWSIAAFLSPSFAQRSTHFFWNDETSGSLKYCCK